MRPPKLKITQGNRLLQELIKEVKWERDTLLLSMTLLSKSQGKQQMTEEKDDSLLIIIPSTLNSTQNSDTTCDQPDESNKEAHAPPARPHTECSSTQRPKGKTNVLLIGVSMIKAIEGHKLSTS